MKEARQHNTISAHVYRSYCRNTQVLQKQKHTSASRVMQMDRQENKIKWTIGCEKTETRVPHRHRAKWLSSVVIQYVKCNAI